MARDRDDDGNEPCSIGEGKIKHETDKAVLAVINGKETWIPKSVLHAESEAYDMEANEGKIVVKQWWAEKNGHA